MKPDKKKQQIKESPVTYDDYAEMPDDGNRYEIVDGVLQMMTPALGTKHQTILRRLTGCFQQECIHSGEFYFAPIDVIFSSGNVRQPDFVFISEENLNTVSERGIEGAPDLLAEILSPSTAKIDKTDKKETYERYGVKEYWILDPHYELLDQFILTEGRYVLHKIYKPEETISSPLFPCINFPLRQIFPVSENH